MYSLIVIPKVNKIFTKISKKNPKFLEIIYGKLDQIVTNPFHFKPLRGNMHGFRRAHVNRSFVLVYEIIEIDKCVRVVDCAHHDSVYES